jgi:hypothetical protein
MSRMVNVIIRNTHVLQYECNVEKAISVFLNKILLLIYVSSIQI